MYPNEMKILVVDDMTTMRKIIMKSCREMGFNNLIEAADGQLAWQKMNETPDVGFVISDWNMPNCSGIDLLKRVRADGRFKDLPFLIVTAETEMSQVQEAVKAGVDNYLCKPFTRDSLQVKMTEIYRKKPGTGKAAA